MPPVNRSIAVRYRQRSLRLLNAGSGVGFVVSHDSLPQNPIEQIRIDEVGVFEVKALVACAHHAPSWSGLTAAVIGRFPGLLHSGTRVGSTGGWHKIPGIGAT